MRPLLLKITAFGPYAEETVLDFAQLQGQQIFVITGPTGAGKTTIFDALCYALFGQTSGEERQSKGLRSDFASEENHRATTVALTFTVRGKTYFIRRQPPQPLPKRGGGWKEGLHEAELSCLGHDEFAPLSRVGEVDEKIVEILGLTYDQFRKIVMIPQGDFRRFLNADTKDKGQILRQLFGTTFFEQVQEKLGSRMRALKNDCDRQQLLMAEKLRTIKSDEQQPLTDKLAEGSDAAQILPLLRDMVAYDERAQESCRQQLIHWQQERGAIEQAIIAGSQLNQLYSQLRQAQSRREALAAQEESMTILRKDISQIRNAQKLEPLAETCAVHRQAADAAQSDSQALGEQLEFSRSRLQQAEALWQAQKTQAAALEAVKSQCTLLSSYTTDVLRLAQEKQTLAVLLTQKNDAAQTLQTLTEKSQANVALLQALEQQQNRLHQCQQEALKLQFAIEQTTQKGKELGALMKQIEHLLTLEQEGPQHQTVAQQAQAALSQEQAQLSSLRRQQIQQYSAKLAAQLQDGQPCPVCGARSHPAPQTIAAALISDEAITLQEQQVNRAQNLANEAAQQLKLWQDKLAAAQDALAENADFAQARLRPAALQAWYAQIKQNHHQLQDDWRQYDHTLRQIQAEMQTLQDTSARKAAAESQRAELETTLNAARQTHLNAETAYSSEYRLYQDLLKRIPQAYHQPEALQNDLNRLSAQIADGEKRLQDAEKAYREAQALVDQLAGQQKQLAQHLADAEEKWTQSHQKWQQAIAQDFATPQAYAHYRALKDQLETYQGRLNQYDSDRQSTAEQILNITAQINGRAEVDLAQLNQQKQAADVAISATQEQQSRHQHRYLHNQGVLHDLEQLLADARQSESRYLTTAHLAKLASGDNPWRMTFETFVLITYFEQVLMRANQRLEKMTGGRYYFLRRQALTTKQRKAGLDIDVMDNYTGKVRAVNTLSGGEGFKASLALALGLSDVVQESAGGVELSTIFIDEGFGTLDSESLDSTIDTLMELQLGGRLVGVISHVAELKERIKAQLVVTPSEKGSRAEFRVN